MCWVEPKQPMKGHDRQANGRPRAFAQVEHVGGWGPGANVRIMRGTKSWPRKRREGRVSHHLAAPRRMACRSRAARPLPRRPLDDIFQSTLGALALLGPQKVFNMLAPLLGPPTDGLGHRRRPRWERLGGRTGSVRQRRRGKRSLAATACRRRRLEGERGCLDEYRLAGHARTAVEAKSVGRERGK